MKNFIYFIGGPKDGQVYSGKIVSVGEQYHHIEIKSSNTNFFITGELPDHSEQESTTYECQAIGVGSKRLFLVDTRLNQQDVFNKVKKYFR